MWSAGVVFYFLLTGDYPFKATKDKTIFEVIKEGIVDLESPLLQGTSKYAKMLLASLL